MRQIAIQGRVLGTPWQGRDPRGRAVVTAVIEADDGAKHHAVAFGQRARAALARLEPGEIVIVEGHEHIRRQK